MSIAIMDCPAGSVVRPLHSHKDIEEVILILDGQGEAWIDGEMVSFRKGDAVFFPPIPGIKSVTQAIMR